MNIKINNIEQHSATVVLTNIDTTYNDRTLHFYLNGTLKNEFTIQDGTTKITFNLTLDNAGAEYTVYIELWGWVSLLGDQLLDWVEDSFITKSEESEPEEPEPEEYWKFEYVHEYNNITQTIEYLQYLNECEVLRIDMTFSISGSIQFQTVNASGAYIFLSSQSSFDEESGEPISSLTDDYSKSGDASIEWLVSPGVDYYLFVRHYDIEDSGKITYRIVVSEKTRPNTFKWTNSKEKGKEFNLTAKEWNDLCQNVNDLLAYCDWWDYSFTKAVKGEKFTAEMFNEILDAIKPISKRTLEELEDYEVKTGDIIKAQALNDLIALVNEIQ